MAQALATPAAYALAASPVALSRALPSASARKYVTPKALPLRVAMRPLRMGHNAISGRRQLLTVYAMDASMGGGAESREVFPLIKERDPYRKLGVNADASSEEIQEARNYLISQHGWDAASRESIEAAYDRIISEKLKVRAKGKINLRGKEKKGEVAPNPWVEKFNAMRDKPSRNLILQRAFLYAFFAVWSVVQAAASGPAFQVAISFVLCVYLLHSKNTGKTVPQYLGVSFVALLVGWLLGTLIPVMIPFIFPPALSPETICALFTYVALFATCTFLK
eukprot:jgi/Mesvir1/28315/Mv04835-RA.1